LALLILPDVSVSTKKVYDNYRHNPALYDKLNNQIKSYICKNRIDLVVNMCANMLQKSCFSLAKELTELKATIESFGMGLLCLSGSGSAMFCLVCNKDEEKVVAYKHKLQEKIGCKSIIVHNNRW
jgi:4-diphosphocytidyl-2C-methyl-D-erythritol kinase